MEYHEDMDGATGSATGPLKYRCLARSGHREAREEAAAAADSPLKKKVPTTVARDEHRADVLDLDGDLQVREHSYLRSTVDPTLPCYGPLIEVLDLDGDLQVRTV